MISGVEHIRKHECDRIGTMATALRRTGIDVTERPDGSTTRPGGPRFANLGTHDDHRMAVALSVPGLAGSGVRLDHADRVGKTCPKFLDPIGSVGAVVARTPTQQRPAVRRPRPVLQPQQPGPEGQFANRRAAGSGDSAAIPNRPRNRAVSQNERTRMPNMQGHARNAGDMQGPCLCRPLHAARSMLQPHIPAWRQKGRPLPESVTSEALARASGTASCSGQRGPSVASLSCAQRRQGCHQGIRR